MATFPPQLNQNSITALCDGVATVLYSQPYRPSGSVLRARRRTLFGAQLPTSPSPEGNAFRDLYNAQGTHMTLRSVADLQRVAGYPVGLPLNVPGAVSYPQTIELNVPWSIGAPGQQRDIHFAFALYVQVMNSASSSSVSPSPGEIPACDFTTHCRRDTPEYDAKMAANRSLRDMACTPIFKQPKLFMMPILAEEIQAAHNQRHQLWYPWQVCANCIAARAKAHCSLYIGAMLVDEPLRVFVLRPGETSEYDHSYGWFTESREAFMDKDIGYYDLWEARNGVRTRLAE